VLREGFVPNRLLRVIVSAVVVVGAGSLLYFSTVRQDAEFYKHVDEVMTNPSDWYGKPVKLHGFVTGDIDHVNATLDYKFQLQNAGIVVPASYHGLVPDTFKDGAEVVLTGKLAADGFHATDMTAKCPSKYEAGGPAATGKGDNK
jgi:cytochrome c-type biogenesis protein CcmE